MDRLDLAVDVTEAAGPGEEATIAIRDRRARMLGLDSASRIEVTMRIEQVAKAIELVVVESQAR